MSTLINGPIEHRAQTQVTPASRAVLLLGMLGNALGAAFLFAALPLLGRQLGFSDIQTGVLVGLGSIGLLFAAPLWGYLSESLGRRPVLLIGLCAVALSPILTGLVASFGEKSGLRLALVFALLLTIRVLHSLLGGGLLPAAQAFMADSSSPSHRARSMGLLGAAFGLGGILGAMVLWKVARGDIYLGFWIVGAASLVACLLAWVFLPETNTNKTQLAADAKEFRIKPMAKYFAITFIGVSSFIALKQITGLRLQDDFGFSLNGAMARTGLILSLSALTMMFSQLVIVRFVRLPLWCFIALASVLSCVALIVAATANNQQLFTVAMATLGLAQGVLLPANLGLMSMQAGASAQGKVAGVNTIFQGLAMVTGPIVGAALFKQSSTLPYWLFALPFVAIALVVIIGKLQSKNE